MALDENSLTDPLFRTREEEKYIIPYGKLDMVIDVVEEHMKPYYISGSTEYNLQRSLYYDSHDFKFLRDHLKDLDTRYKMRLRQYAPNGKWSQDAFLEVKYREKGVQKKLRLKIDNYTQTCVGSEKLNEKTLKKLNPDMPDPDFKEAYELINDISLKYQVSKVSNVTYKRLSYKGKSTRMGLDTNVEVASRRRDDELSADPLRKDGLWGDLKKYDGKYNPDVNAIVEIKHQKEQGKPEWFTELMGRIDNETGFSKFVWSMSQLLK